MKKYIFTSVLVVIVTSTQLFAHEEIDREGFNFGIGVVAIGGCEKIETWDEKGENIVDRERYCGAIPLLDMTLGYGFTSQFELSLDMKTLIIGSLVGVKAKYYMQDARDTSFLSLTGGVLDVGGGHSGPGASSYNNIEWGYAYGKKEFSIGVGALYGDSNIVLHLGYKYMF